MSDYSFVTDESSAFDFSVGTETIVDATETTPRAIDVDCSVDNQTLDAELSASDSNIDAVVKDYINNRTTNTYSISQEDTSNIELALSKLDVKQWYPGDMIVISNPETEKTSGYVYTKEGKWITFNGNSGASTTVFEKDILCAGNYTQVGNVTKSAGGVYTLPAKGKTVEEVMTSIFTQELQPTKTEPSVSITFTGAGMHEVGSVITPTYSASLSAGSYTYGPATGVKATAWTITDTRGETSQSYSSSLPSLTIEDATNYSISAVATHNAGTVAVTNIGNASSPVVQIAAGSKSRTSSAAAGYRAFFYGALTTDKTTPLTSDIIRSLTNGGNYNSSKVFNINPISGGKRYIVAIPASSTRAGLKSAILPNSLNAEVVNQYTAQTVSVEGKNGYAAVNYKVYVYEPASIGGNEIHKITLG